MRAPPEPDPRQAEAIAIEALGFIARDPELLSRFLALTGISASDIRLAAREPGFLAGVLEFVLAHEPTLMAFSEATGTDPALVPRARLRLPGADGTFDASYEK